MNRHFYSPVFRNITWLVLVTFLQTLVPQQIWAVSPWAHKRYQEASAPVQKAEEEENGAGASSNTSADPLVIHHSDLKPVFPRNSQISKLEPVPAPAEPSQDNRNGSGKGRSATSFGGQNSKLSTPIAAVLDVYSTSLSGAELREISNSFRREVKNTGKFLVYNKAEMRKALSKNLDQEIAAARQIDEYVTQARRLYDEFKFDAAGAIMKEAMAAIGAFDATPAVARKISEAYLTQGLILDAQGKEKEAEGAFLNAASLDPDRQLDPTRYPPSVIGKFYKAKADFPKIKKGSLRIETTPPVAEVILGDKRLGTTPSTLKDLPLGIQKITLFKDGYEPWEKNVMIVATSNDEYSNKIEIDLNKTGQSVSLDALIGEVVSRKDYDSQISKMADVGKLLVADQVFAARIEKGDKGYDLFITEVDSRSGKEAARGYALIDPNLADVDVSMAHALGDMFSGKQPAQFTQLIAVEGKDSNYMASYKKSKPFYKTWPFFMIIGLVVAGGGAGAAVALTRGGGGGPPTGSATIGGAPQP